MRYTSRWFNYTDIQDVSKNIGEMYQKTNKTEDTKFITSFTSACHLSLFYVR
jgi:hypothetical protein